jgi:NADH-quinone oxidoreductase subunit H
MDIWPANYWVHWAIFAVIILAFVLTLVMGFIYIERRVLGRFQVRLGPNRCGPFGILQPVADALKVALKEDIIPAKGDKWVHLLAPVICFIPVLMVFAVIPFHNGHGLVPDLNIGILYIVAIGSLGMLGTFMAGWGSNNKYSLIGAMRAVAQTVSYEIPLVLALVGIVLITGSLSMNEIVEAQNVPFILLQPLGFLIFFMAMAAEINRTPFDLLEAESEIVAGYHTEYSGLKFALFYLTEYAEALVMSALVTTLFLSGWKPAPAGFWWFLVKVLFVFFLIIWVRATIPRLRVDQWMGFAWKCLLPLALINLIITGIEVVGWGTIPWWAIFINIPVCGLLILLWSRFFRTGGGRVEVRTVWDRDSQRASSDLYQPAAETHHHPVS